jgi:hypothetical protein
MNVQMTINAATEPVHEHHRLPRILTKTFWVQSDPNPEYSRLDHLDGLGTR